MGESREMRRRAAGALAVVAIVAAAVLAFAGNPIPVVVAAAEEVLPEANTDGVLAYACLTAGGTYDICVTNPATGDFANVTNTGGLNETDPTWSPDGRAILAVSSASGGNNDQPQAPGDGELVRIDVTDPTNPGPIRGTGIQGFAPDWGPDGDLVFSRFSYPPPYHNRAPIEVVFTRYSEIWSASTASERFSARAATCGATPRGARTGSRSSPASARASHSTARRRRGVSCSGSRPPHGRHPVHSI